MSARRFVLEGEWTGHTASQRRVVHREVVTAKQAERLRKLHGIQYTDGTRLLLSVRDAKPREKVAEIKSYTSLINEALAMGQSFVRVADMKS